MIKINQPIYIYLEIGKKKVVAGRIEWPGCQRFGRSEDDALVPLVAYGPHP